MQVYAMFMITNLIEPRMGKLVLNHLIRNNILEFLNGLLDSYFFKTDLRKWLFGTFLPESRFQNHPDLVKLQKHQSLSNKSFKHNSVPIRL